MIADEFDLSTITTSDAIFAVVALVSSALLSQAAKRTLRRTLNDIEGMPLLADDVIARIARYVVLTFGVVLALEALAFSFGLVGSVSCCSSCWSCLQPSHSSRTSEQGSHPGICDLSPRLAPVSVAM